MNTDDCKDCGCESHDICWPKQNYLREKWLQDNPDAGFNGWWSI